MPPQLAASPGAPPVPTPNPAPNPAVSTSAAPSGGAKSHAALLGIADEITRQVAAMRGLPQKAQFQRGVLSRAEIVQKLHERMAKEYSKEEVRIESAVLRRLGLLPEGVDYEQTLLDLLGEQVAGFYDPYATTLYIADWLPLEMQRPALAHEIEHALQDQHFDLKKFSQAFKDDGDRQLARSSIVEGDGTALMLEYTTRDSGHSAAQIAEEVARLGKQMMQLSMGATPIFQKAPPALRETLVFPYTSGLEFVTARRLGAAGAQGGTPSWKRVDDLFRDPPDSTEQILHPEKYEVRERPVRITAAPLTSLAPRKEARRDVMGELIWRLWFDSQLSVAQATDAAAGWGGDRLVAYEGPGDALPAVINLSAWDSDADANEAEAAARKVLMILAGQKEPSGSSSSSSGHSSSVGPAGLFREKGGVSFGLVRRGRLLLIVAGIPKGTEARVTDEVFGTFKVEWPPPAAPPPPAAAPAAPAPATRKPR